MIKNIILIAAIFFTACSPASEPESPTILQIEYSLAVQPWLVDIAACVENFPSYVIQTEPIAGNTISPSSDLALILGEPGDLKFPAYQIGTEDIEIIVNTGNLISELSFNQIQGLFSGSISNWKDVGGDNKDVKPWVFALESDIQRSFTRGLPANIQISTHARLATRPQEMVTAVSSDTSAVGIVLSSWITANVKSVYSETNVPVLAVAPKGVQGVVEEILACLQD